MKSILKKVAVIAAGAALALGMIGCSAESEDNLALLGILNGSGSSHEHTFADEWTSDATHHWHAATCGHTAEVKDKAEHTFGDWTSNNDATTEADGTKSRTCSVCSYKETVTDAGSKLPSAQNVATPVFSVAEGAVTSGTSVTITCTTEGAKIYYTTDGSTPTASSTEYTAAISVTEAVTLKAIAVKDGMNNSVVASVSYTIKETVATPAFSVASGAVNSGTSVTITCTTEGAKIYYTTDDSTPTAASTEYTAAISVTTAVTIKAIAVKDGMNNSAVASAAYTIAINDDFVEINYSEGNFFISPTELTYTEWYEVYQWAVTNGYIFQDLGREGSNGTDGAAPTEGSKQPVTYVSWRDAVVWCNAASEKAGLTPVYEYEDSVLKEAENYSSKGTNSENTTSVGAGNGKAEKATVNKTANGYRLPTEAEWEYAAKGGANFTYSGSDNIDEVAWYLVNSSDGTKDVGTKVANGYELHDMSGNVWEWCQDTWSSGSSNRVSRGGGWNDLVGNCAVSFRGSLNPYDQYNILGFRVVRNAN